MLAVSRALLAVSRALLAVRLALRAVRRALRAVSRALRAVTPAVLRASRAIPGVRLRSHAGRLSMDKVRRFVVAARMFLFCMRRTGPSDWWS